MSPPLGSGSGSGSDLSERQTPSRDFRSMTPGCGVTPPPPQTESASLDVSGDGIMHLEPRPFRPFKTSEEYLYAMKEDLAEWLNTLYGLNMTAENFMEVLETGVVLCDHANSVRRCADQFQTEHVERRGRRFSAGFRVPSWDVSYNRQARAGSFFARDNIHNFIRWCNELGVLDCLMFETEDLVSRKNEKHVILCLLEIARRGAKFGMAAPILVQFEQQIDREIAREQAGEDAEDAEDEQELEDEPEEPPMVYGPTQQVVTNDLKSLDEMVRDLVERCSCPSQFPMIRVSEGKYRIGDTKTLIFVRILRNHVMVRVGGGWDTLEHYLDKHDPCRCRSGHRATIASRLFMKPGTHDGERQLSAVKYERHDGDLSSEAGSSPALRTPISFRGSPALRRPSQLSAPDKRLYEEVSGDSSSEVSDEGYRSQGHWKGAHSLKGAENMDRPESSLTHSSTESSDPTTEQPMSPTTPTTPTAPWPSELGDKPAKTRRSFMGMIKSLRPPKASPPPPTAATPPPAPQRRMSTDSLRRGGLQRSQSGGSEAGLRASVRTNRASEARMARCGKNTWSGGGRQRERPALGADTFRAPPPNRATSASPGPRRRAPPQPAASPAPRRKHSHLLADLMDDPELDDDAKVLQKMEELVRQYKPFLAQRQREVDGLSPPPGASSSVSPPPPPAPRVTPRKESGAGVGKSRIPAPTFFQQARSPTETCL